jgi:hypothetical protein
VVIDRTDSYLHQTPGETLFHDAGKGTRMGESVALESIVQVGMRVDVQDQLVVEDLAAATWHNAETLYRL